MKMKKLIVPGVYLTAILLVMGSIYLTVSGINKYYSKRDDFNYSIDAMNEKPTDIVPKEVIPVNTDETKTEETSKKTTTILKPYLSDKVTIGRNYYNYQGEQKDQENSIIFYENTYMQNTGIDYVSEEAFDVVSVLPGKVISISSDDSLGNIIKIEHEKNIISVYEGVNNIKVKENDQIKEGTVIATSGTSNINTNFKESLHFEVYYKGEIINPEEFYKMNLNNIE